MVDPGRDQHLPQSTPTTSFGRTRTVRMPHVPAGGADPATTVGIARGAGCSYGDQSLCSGGVAWKVDDSFHVDDGEVVAAGGAVLRDVLGALWPTGRTLPVLPGSLEVTVGGAIAADVHGKNHGTAGTFGTHVRELTLATPTGTRTVGPGRALFDATTGGMGLTGTITAARLATAALPSAWAHHTVRAVRDTDELLGVVRGASRTHEHVAAWVDLAGERPRGIVETSDVMPSAPRGVATHPTPQPPRVRVPRLPVGLVSRPAIRAFNEVRWRNHSDGARPVPLARALTPLGDVADFSRVFGPDGMVQHQSLVPDGHDDLLVDLLQRFARSPSVPALVVLKRLGDAGAGHLSFPRPGWTLAVDLPAGERRLASVLDAVDEDLAEVGGRIYLAKDAVARPHVVARMYPRLPEWRRVADAVDPGHVVTSDMDRRLGLRREWTNTDAGSQDA